MLTLGIMCGGREYILNALEDDPTWQRTRIKSPEGAASLLVNIAKGVCLDEASALILPDIQKFWQTYETTNGPPPEDTGSDWYEGHDDGLMEVFEPYADSLSGSWLAYVSTDIRLWQDGEDEKLAKSFAQEVWKQLTWKRTDNQILAGVGIVHADLSKYGYMPPPEVPIIKPEFNPMRVNAVLNRIMLMMPDTNTLADDLDLASDEDEALRMSAASRLGIPTEDTDILFEARSLSAGAPDAWFNAIEAGELLDEAINYVDLSGKPDETVPKPPPSGTKPLPPLPPLPGAPNALTMPPGLPPIPARPLPPLPPPSVSQGTSAAPTSKPGRKPKVQGEAPAGTIPVEVLRSIKDHSGVKDEDLADMMGISRPTLGNIMKGKTWYVPPDPSRKQALLNMLVKHTEELTKAYQAINGG